MKTNLWAWGIVLGIALSLHRASAGMERINGELCNRGWGEYQHLLETADRLTLFSLSPERPAESKASKRKRKTSTTYFDGYPVRGQTGLPLGTNRAHLLASLGAGVSNAVSRAECFLPRHGLRAHHGAEVTDFVLCFRCHLLFVRSPRGDASFMVTGEPAAVFNATLEKAGVPVAKEKTLGDARRVFRSSERPRTLSGGP